MEDDPADAGDKLEECQKQLEQLTEENAQLRASAQSFGDLAERLNIARRRALEARLPHRRPRQS
jgi:hypothetical protein